MCVCVRVCFCPCVSGSTFETLEYYWNNVSLKCLFTVHRLDRTQQSMIHFSMWLCVPLYIVPHVSPYTIIYSLICFFNSQVLCEAKKPFHHPLSRGSKVMSALQLTPGVIWGVVSPNTERPAIGHGLCISRALWYSEHVNDLYYWSWHHSRPREVPLHGLALTSTTTHYYCSLPHYYCSLFFNGIS